MLWLDIDIYTQIAVGSLVLSDQWAAYRDDISSTAKKSENIEIKLKETEEPFWTSCKHYAPIDRALLVYHIHFS